MKKCSYLNDYSVLIGKVKQGLKNKLSRRQAIIQAIDWCINNDIMKDYLTEKRNEVFSMLDFQWDLDEAKIAWQNKGRAEERDYIALNMLRKGFSFDDIQELTKLSIDKIKELAKNRLNSEQVPS